MSGVALSWVLVAALIHATWNLLAKKTGGDVRFALVSQVAVALVWAPGGPVVRLARGGRLGACCNGRSWGPAVPSTRSISSRCCAATGWLTSRWCTRWRAAPGPCSRPWRPHCCWASRWGCWAGWVCWGWCWASCSSRAGRRCGMRCGAGRGAQADADGDTDADRHLRRLRAGIGYGLLTGLCIAGYTVVDGYAVKAGRHLAGVGGLPRQCGARADDPAVDPGAAPARAAAAGRLLAQHLEAGTDDCRDLAGGVCAGAVCRPPSRRCRMWRQRARCRCCSPRCWAAPCCASATRACGCWAPAALLPG